MQIMKNLLRGPLSCAYEFDGKRYVLRSAGPFSAEPEELLNDGIILKDSRSVISGLDSGKRYFIKKYKKNGWWRTLKRQFQFPRAFRCLAAALRLQELGIETPEVLLASRYCLITEVLPENLHYLTAEPECIDELIKFVAGLHHSGIRHGDLNLRNLYRTSHGGFGVIDLDGAILYKGEVPKSVRFLEVARVISSYLKCVQAKPETWEDRTLALAGIYQQISGYDLYDSQMVSRVGYLASRR